MKKAFLIATLSIFTGLTGSGAIIAWSEGHFSHPIARQTYEPCGTFERIFFRGDGRVELVGKASHEIYDYEIIDGHSVAIKSPISTFVVSFRPDGTLSWSAPMTRHSQECRPSIQQGKPATEFFRSLILRISSKSINPDLKRSWESVYLAAYGSSPVYTRGTMSYDPTIKRSYDSADLYGWAGKKATGIPQGMSFYVDLKALRPRTSSIAKAACAWLEKSSERHLQIGASGDGSSGGKTGGMTINSETCRSGPTWQLVGAER